MCRYWSATWRGLDVPPGRYQRTATQTVSRRKRSAELDVEVRPQLPGRDPVAEQPGPELPEALVAFLEVGEPVERQRYAA